MGVRCVRQHQHVLESTSRGKNSELTMNPNMAASSTGSSSATYPHLAQTGNSASLQDRQNSTYSYGDENARNNEDDDEDDDDEEDDDSVGSKPAAKKKSEKAKWSPEEVFDLILHFSLCQLMVPYMTKISIANH